MSFETFNLLALRGISDKITNAIMYFVIATSESRSKGQQTGRNSRGRKTWPLARILVP